jgi:YfiH family protein
MNVAGLRPLWPAPAGVHAFTSFRSGGVSEGEFAGLNLGGHVGDHPERVAENRRRLTQCLRLPAEPLWLSQVHGSRIVDGAAPATLEADGAWTDQSAVVCAVMTADCLPILLCDVSGRKIAAVHAGWRGLAEGVIEAAVAALQPAELMAWLGPAIGPDAFEVGPEVRQAFTQRHGSYGEAFRPGTGDRWLADIYMLARLVLEGRGIGRVYGGGLCTHSDSRCFFSHRRDGRTGRMATLIWRT